MARFKVVAERGTSGVWVLECPEVGAVSQTSSLDKAADEMREPIAYLAGLEEKDVLIDVEEVSAPIPVTA